MSVQAAIAPLRDHADAFAVEPGAVDALERALAHLASQQHASGFWEAEMVWNSMPLSQWVMVQHAVGRLGSLDERTRQRILRHYEVTRTRDGAWGMHGEGDGYVFMTSLAYVALRLLGCGPEHPLVAPARAWLHAQPGGVRAVPTWGKFWLAMFGLYGWEGVNPIPPELFLLPDAVPLQPNNFYCHTRYIYLGIAYLYGRRFTVELGALGRELRGELYGDVSYEQIDFAAYRHAIAASDVYVRPNLALRVAWDALAAYERVALPSLRQRALKLCLERIAYEQEVTRGQGLSPVNGLLDCLALHDAGHPARDASLEAMLSWRWQDDEEGVRYCGAHSTSWDTAFALRALTELPAALDGNARAAAVRGYRWLCDAQMQEELPGHVAERRDPILGGWCFSDGVHRWPVSDCTAEAVSAILQLHEVPGLLDGVARISDARLTQAARFMLLRQNADGGFGTYERRRGSLLLEALNPSEMYANCMTERSYTECTASCVAALSRFRARYPRLLRAELDRAIARGVALLRKRQLADGSWLGFWGVNFTYAIFLVVEALRAAGTPPGDPALARAAAWLMAKQKTDGGWGEHWTSCVTERYVEHPESQATMTAWALLALLETLPVESPMIGRGVACLERLQGANGEWPRQGQAGVFFTTALLDYRLYKDYFPAWALARHRGLTAHK